MHCSIRPLQNYDLRSRKLSGRHQISYDGKHLIDGVAFGRPFLRRTERPPISIPPRKRIRLSYGADAGGDTVQGVDDGRIILKAGFVNADKDSEDDTEGDDEDILDDEEDVPVEELGDILRESESILGGDGVELYESPDGATHVLPSADLEGRLTRSRRRVRGLGLDNGEVLKLVDDHGRPFPGDYNNALLDYYMRDDVAPDLIMAPTSKKRKRFAGKCTSRTRVSNLANRRNSTGSAKNVRFEASTQDVNGILLTDDDDECDDKNFLPTDGVDSGEESDKENFEPETISSDSSTISSVTESESSETSSSLSSSSSSSSADEDSSDSKPEEVDSHEKDPRDAKAPVSKSPRPDSSGKASLEQEKDETSPNRNVPPGQGQNRTQKRNQRRRDHKRIEYLKKAGILAPHATRQDYKLWEDDHNAATHADQTEQPVDQQSKEFDEEQEFETKRKELLNSIASGGVEVGKGTPHSSFESSKTLIGDVDAIMDEITKDQTQTPATAPKSLPNNEATSTEVASGTSQRRNKLDLASSRRLLFGSLGLRTPKTKDDEQRMREKLMEQSKPALSGKDAPGHRMGLGLQLEEKAADDDGKWKSKVILKAVECCHNGVELSSPPFPFVQRWDPQQRGVSKAVGKKGKTKKRKRLEAQYYQESEQQYAYENEFEDQQGKDEAAVEPQGEAPVQNQPPKSPFPDEIRGAVNDQLMRDADGVFATAPEALQDPEDLPVLPEDMSSTSPLEKKDAIPGAIIAFKQLEMSQGTNWQPKISDFRTAIVIKNSGDELLQINLSNRDRLKNAKSYDEETGERIYEKFEMPEYEEEDSGEDDGLVEIMFGDLIEPKLIQRADFSSAHSSEQLATTVAQPQETLSPIEDVENNQHSDQSNNLTAEEADKMLYGNDPIEVNDEVRKEILKLMKDIGFRSSVGPEIAQTEHEGNGEVTVTSKDDDKLVNEDVVVEDGGSPDSPRFNGFGSSSPPITEDDHDSRAPSQESSKLQNPESPKNHAINGREDVHGLDSISNISFLENAGDGLQDDGSKDMIDVSGELGNDSDSESDAFQGRNYKQSPNTLTTSSPPVAVTAVRRSRNISFRSINRPFAGLDGASSDNDLPSLENVFSSARSSTEMPAPERNSKQIPPPRRTTTSISISDSKATLDVDLAAQASEDGSTPRASQIPTGSQIVDLTLSSDPVEPVDDDSEYRDRSELPSGPGWVKKRKTRSDLSKKAMGKRPVGKARKIRSL